MGADVTDFRAGGSRPRTFRKFYKVVIQAKLLFGGESWVVSPLIGRTLGGFHYRVARQLENI